MRAGKKIVLTMDLTPIFMSGFALWKFAPGVWRSVRKSLLLERGSSCEICNYPAKNVKFIDAHEGFEYGPDVTVRLTRVQLLCKPCHECKHFDHMIRMGRIERSELLIEHFCRVNNCSREEFEQHYAQALAAKDDLESRFPSNLSATRVHYGPYHERVLKSRTNKGRREMNWWQATERALNYAIRQGLHPDYRDEVIDIVKSDDVFRERLTACVGSKNLEEAYGLLTTALEEVRDDELYEPLPDHEFVYTPEGDMFGHRWPGE